MRTQGEDSYIQANRRGLEQLPASQPSEGTNPADILILDLEFLDSRFVRQYISFIWTIQFVVISYSNPSELIRWENQKGKQRASGYPAR